MTTMALVTKLEAAGAKLRVDALHTDHAALLEGAVAEVVGKLVSNPPILVFRKLCHQQRAVGFFADPNVTRGYFYSGSCAPSQPIGPGLKALLDAINAAFGSKFNGVLVNRYADGADYIADHSDNEAGLDPGAGVVIVSQGAPRTMRFKARKDAPPGTPRFKNGSFDVELSHGSVVAMSGPNFQRTFTHGIPVQKRCTGARVSFTFRFHDGKNEDALMQRYLKNKATMDTMAEEPAAKRARGR